MIKRNLTTLYQNMTGQNTPKTNKLMTLFQTVKRLEFGDVQLNKLAEALERDIKALDACEYDTRRLVRICLAIRKVQTGIQKEKSFIENLNQE